MEKLHMPGSICNVLSLKHVINSIAQYAIAESKAIHVAVKKDNLPVFQFLIKIVDPMVRDRKDHSPLHRIAKLNRIEMCEILRLGRESPGF